MTVRSKFGFSFCFSKRLKNRLKTQAYERGKEYIHINIEQHMLIRFTVSAHHDEYAHVARTYTYLPIYTYNIRKKNLKKKHLFKRVTFQTRHRFQSAGESLNTRAGFRPGSRPTGVSPATVRTRPCPSTL